MRTFKKISVPKVGNVGGAGSDHHDKIRASISERVHHHSTLSEDWHTRNKRAELIVVGMLPQPGFDLKRRVYSKKGIVPTLQRAMGAGGGITPKFLEIREL